MIRIDQFHVYKGISQQALSEIQKPILNLRNIQELAGGEAALWEAYFDPDGMDGQVRSFMESAINPIARTVAVMLRAALKRMEK